MQMARMLFGWVAERAPGGGLMADEEVRGLLRCIAHQKLSRGGSGCAFLFGVPAVTSAKCRACGLGEGGALSDNSVCGGM